MEPICATNLLITNNLKVTQKGERNFLSFDMKMDDGNACDQSKDDEALGSNHSLQYQRKFMKTTRLGDVIH